MAESDHDQRVANRRGLTKKLEAAGWGLFFIWIGIALLADVGWGVGLLGVGIIILGAQVSRRYLALVPILCIVAGVALLASALDAGPRD